MPAITSAICAALLLRFPITRDKHAATLDALHWASADFLRQQGQLVQIASYDRRFADAARDLGFALFAV